MQGIIIDLSYSFAELHDWAVQIDISSMEKKYGVNIFGQKPPKTISRRFP